MFGGISGADFGSLVVLMDSFLCIEWVYCT